MELKNRRSGKRELMSLEAAIARLGAPYSGAQFASIRRRIGATSQTPRASSASRRGSAARRPRVEAEDSVVGIVEVDVGEQPAESPIVALCPVHRPSGPRPPDAALSHFCIRRRMRTSPIRRSRKRRSQSWSPFLALPLAVRGPVCGAPS